MNDRIVQREEVRALLHVCKNRDTSVAVRDGLVAELCRTWLAVQDAPLAVMDKRDALGICAPTEEDFPELYALQGKRVRIVQDPAP